jgi:adenine deaminase
MLPPWEFARIAMRHGTVASVSDPHEIANVLGADGVRYMLDDIAGSPFTCWFGCPSCVPATDFETAGAVLDAAACERLLDDPRIGYLSEMMNWPGAIGGDLQVLAKIAAAKARGKPVDGHAPGLAGEQAKAYFARGIETDHECFTLEEARGKAALGVKVLIREGSAARNFEALWPLLGEHPIVGTTPCIPPGARFLGIQFQVDLTPHGAGKSRKHPVVVACWNRIVLVVMTARATDS